MFKTRYPIPGESPGQLRPRDEAISRQPVITLIEYDRAHLEERTITFTEELLPHLDNQRVTWINIDGLGDIEVLRALGSRFNLHPLALEDVLDTGQRPKVEQYDDYLFIVVQMLYLNEAKQMCGEQVSMFLGKHFLITLQEEADFDVFEPVRARIRVAKPTIRKLGADYSGLRAARFHRRSLLSRSWKLSVRRSIQLRRLWLTLHSKPGGRPSSAQAHPDPDQAVHLASARSNQRPAT